MSDTQDHYEIVDRLFEEARALPASDRAAYLDSACANVPREYRDEVESLLNAEQRLARRHRPFFERLTDDSQPPEAPPADPMIGQMVGPYRIKEQVGSGGFGDVYAAMRTGEFEQHVAVKLVRRDRQDNQMILRRFELERQVLADLNHRHIARLLDGGSTPDGRPYFVMELVRGVQITDYCADRRIPVEKRLRLMESICFAVANAHRLGVIHRDIKPGNILVTSDGEPKLVDFGIAKLVGQKADRRVETLTETGHLPMTPTYASPEQIRREPVGTSSDVYSLGVVLYELLTGRKPFDTPHDSVSAAASGAYESTIRRPSVVVRTDSEGSLSRCGLNVTAESLGRKLRGDLDNIVLKALRAEADQRYQSAADLADDIQRYLAGRPVAASKGSWRYRVGKFARRNRLAAFSIVAVAAAVLVSAVSIVVAWQRSASLSRDLEQSLYESEMHHAYAAWNDANVERAGEFLRNQLPRGGQTDRRDFAWYYLAHLYHQNDIAFHPLPNRTARVAYDGHDSAFVQFEPDRVSPEVDLESGPVFRLDLTRGEVSHLADVEGTLLAIGQRGPKLLVKPPDVPAGDSAATPGDTNAGGTDASTATFFVELRDVPAGTSRQLALPFSPESGAISPDESLVAAIASDGAFRIWNAETGEVLWDESRPMPRAASESTWHGVTFSADNQWIALHCRKASGAMICNITSRRSRRIDVGEVFALRFDRPAGKLAIAASQLHLLDLSDIDAPTVVLVGSVFNGRQILYNGPSPIDFSPDGEYLAEMSPIQRLKVWHVSSKRLVAERATGVHYPQQIFFDASGRRLVYIGQTEYFVWNVFETTDSVHVGARFNLNQAMATRGDPLCVGFGGLEDDLIVWEPDKGDIRTIPSRQEPSTAVCGASAVAISSDGNLVAAADAYGEIVVWDRSVQRRIHSLNRTSRDANPEAETDPRRRKRISSLAFAPNSRSLVAADYEQITGWDLTAGQPRWIAPTDGQINGITFVGDQSFLVAGDGPTKGLLRQWDVTNNAPRVVREWPHPFGISTTALSPDGRYLATFDGDHFFRGRNALNIYDLHTLQDGPRHIADHEAWVQSASFAGDSRTLVAWSADGLMAMWNVESGRRVARLNVDHEQKAIDIVKLDDNRMAVVSGMLFGDFSDDYCEKTGIVRVQRIDKPAIDRFFQSHRSENASPPGE